MDSQEREIIGLLPAAGLANRIAPLPCSKELFPIGFHQLNQLEGERPKAVCLYLLESMKHAGVKKSFVILRDGKWDIPAFLGDGRLLDMQLAYLMMNLPYGAPYTLDQAYPFVQDALIAVGFPDIIFQPNDAFAQLVHNQKETDADLVLGLFPVDQPHKMDMVALDENGRVQQIVIKPKQTQLKYTWFIAVWTPKFTHFMHHYLHEQLENATLANELYLGDVIQAALDNEFHVESVLFANGRYIDIGTPDDLMKAVVNQGQIVK